MTEPAAGISQMRRPAVRAEVLVDGLAEPISHYTHATTFGDLIFVSGCTGTDGTGRLVSDDPTEQARRALRNLAAILQAAGATLADVLKVTVYLTDIDDRAAVDVARREAFGSSRPASTLVEVTRLARVGARVEIEAIAARAAMPEPPNDIPSAGDHLTLPSKHG
jgi:2-iminobutanoate/2-iminopropanoate deaminase